MTSTGRTPVAYTPYGLRPAPKGASITGFTGQLREVELGCYLLGNGHRAFSPSLMRFFSADVLSPFGLGGVNCYAYCHGDPINRVDPTGQYEGWFAHQVTMTANGLVLGQVGLAIANQYMETGTISYGTGARWGIAGATAAWGFAAGVHQRNNGDEGSVVADVTTVLAPAIAFGDELYRFGRNVYRRVRDRVAARFNTPPGSPNTVITSEVNRRDPNNAEHRANTVQEAVELNRQLLAQQDGEEVNYFQFPEVGGGGQLNASAPQEVQASIRG
ncbi:RHS repeat-associated core domain-containing protein [Pseudomonas peradeniyensis]|uniref:RHS repeat-associated core domain-containing protein n=2 Tax=Pseudomonas peradeniyensis TaxID=2745488 RepID=A0ABT2V487_9PSED|nr:MULTISPECIES: RHS repeat-associated core domain-containing protein [Pseudomonas]MCU7236555.1 RHS repeat-associated core domain-containing protein [Pseudomonas peradeniyensis]MCU7278347.1 RHS repeat-associated core domain-containing protein [Pseudomonas peradeniyensis]